MTPAATCSERQRAAHDQQLPDKLRAARHDIAIRQLHGGVEVGRITWHFGR